eukprot:490059-Pleurochrysis_carterae.AAC.1
MREKRFWPSVWALRAVCAGAFGLERGPIDASDGLGSDSSVCEWAQLCVRATKRKRGRVPVRVRGRVPVR